MVEASPKTALVRLFAENNIRSVMSSSCEGSFVFRMIRNSINKPVPLRDRDSINVLMAMTSHEAPKIRLRAGNLLINEVTNPTDQSLRLETLDKIAPLIVEQVDRKKEKGLLPSYGQLAPHTHSLMQDGYETLTASMVNAFYEGVKYRVITDHDYLPVQNNNEGMHAAEIIKKHGGDVNYIPGIEISTIHDDTIFHLLLIMPDYIKKHSLLDNDPVVEQMKGHFDRYRPIQHQILDTLINLVNNYHSEIQINKEQVLSIARGVSSQRSILTDALWFYHPEYFRKYCKEKNIPVRPFKGVWYDWMKILHEDWVEESDKQYPLASLDMVIAWTNAVGGNLIIAHPNEFLDAAKGDYNAKLDKLNDVSVVLANGLGSDRLFGISKWSTKPGDHDGKIKTRAIVDKTISYVRQTTGREMHPMPESDYHGFFTPQINIGIRSDYPADETTRRNILRFVEG